MNIILLDKNKDQSYQPIQSWRGSIPAGYAEFPDKFMDVFYPTDKLVAGFVTIEHDGQTVTSCTWNEEAYQAWLEASGVNTLESAKAAKLAEINAACTAAIEAGCDVTLSDGTAGHISLTLPDQINLSTAQEAIKAGGTGYAYHLDGALCEVYPAADIAIMAQAATAHVLYHQTYCNHVRVWVKRCETVVDVEAITYGAAPPDDLAAHMAAVLGGGNA